MESIFSFTSGSNSFSGDDELSSSFGDFSSAGLLLLLGMLNKDFPEANIGAYFG
jgi:hypothetical protein